MLAVVTSVLNGGTPGLAAQHGTGAPGVGAVEVITGAGALARHLARQRARHEDTAGSSSGAV